MSNRTLSLLWKWLPVVCWIGIIVLESTDMMSATHTGQWLYSFVTRVFGQVDRARFEIFHHILRKCGHFLGYGILAALFFRSLRATFTDGLGTLCCWSIALTGGIAALDEWHQSFIPSRTGCVSDVILDTFGAATILLVLLTSLRIYRNLIPGGSEG